MKPRLLDLFCGAGGATKGYQRAGFYVVGVDLNPQPHYCGDEFYQEDALNWIPFAASLAQYDAVHASPPCQEFTTMSNRARVLDDYASPYGDLLTPTLERLSQMTVPWVVENVVGAASLMPNAVLLRGGMFGLNVDRPRLFASNVLLMARPNPQRVLEPVGVYGARPDGRRLFTRADGSEQRAASSLSEAQAAMGMDWGDWHGVKEAIPPAYTEFIGAQLLNAIAAGAS